MRNAGRQKLTLDRPETYQIKVPGKLDVTWSDWVDDVSVITGSDDKGLPVTTLIGTFDQAALQGLLRRLYSFGLPLISLKWIEKNDKDQGILD